MAWAGRADEMLTFAISIPITAHYSGQQQLKRSNHEGWLGPGRAQAKGFAVWALGLGFGGSQQK